MTLNNNLIDFAKIVQDFGKDLSITFEDKLTNIDPDLKIIIDADLTILNNTEDSDETIIESLKTAIMNVHGYCSETIPMRFFDILYQNCEIFAPCNEEKSDTDKCMFLPSVDFKELWQEDITDNTRESIWKYLQLLMFSIINDVNNKTSFGDTAKLFEAIDEGEFRTKLEDTIKGLEHLFTIPTANDDMAGEKADDSSGNSKFSNDFNPEDIHNHINGIMNGKLGQLAQELAEETAKEFDLDGENIGDVKDVFQKLFKNPQKLMGLVKNVGSKLDEKMKSGDIKESELLEEASAMFNNMKNMPNMNGQMNELFKNMNIPNIMKNMGMGGAGSGGKFNQGAFNNMMNENMKNSKMRERMKSKLESRKGANTGTNANGNTSIQDNIKNNFDYLFNNPATGLSQSPDLTELNNSLQSLVEQMKLSESENSVGDEGISTDEKRQSSNRKKKAKRMRQQQQQPQQSQQSQEYFK